VEQTPQGFASEDEEATYCLSLLRDGDRHQQIVARERLSQIFESRGMLDEAAQCLESNIREGVRDPRVYQRLAGVYRRQGRHELADEVLVEARRLAERLARTPQPGQRRPGPGRPARPAPVGPAEPQDGPTAQMPAAAPTPVATPVGDEPVPGESGELELDRYGTGLQGWSAEAVEEPPERVGRPWWLSPAMLVVLILLCGPYGLALMWVRSGYSKPAKVRATVVWGGLIVLMMAAAAVTIQSQLGTIIAGVAGVGGIPGAPRVGNAPTPIVFGTPSSAAGVPKAPLPPGLSVLPPTPAASPGALATRPAGVVIAPPAATKPEPDDDEDEAGDEGGPAMDASPTPGQPGGGPAPAAKPTGEQVKVAESADTGVNMRERPGAAGPVIKTVSAGTVLRVVGSDQQIDGKAWKNVRDDTGSTGWIAEEFLEPA
jgi:uncharacterized protein YgiM (DUF1202 family)